LASELTKGDLSIAGARVPPKTRFNAKVSSHRVFDGVPFPLADVRAIKEAVPGATVNDAILAIIGGGLRIYLNDKGELPEANLTAMAPISVRQENEKAALGNLVSAMVVSLGTHIADPMERLAHIHADAVNSKGLTNAVGARTLTDYSQLIPSGLAGLGARLYTRLGVANATAPVFNVVATNVPGSRVPLYFAGAKMVKMYGLGPIFDSMGLINTIYSYVDEIAISFTCDRDMMPDPDAYAAALRQSFDELLAAAKAGPVPAAKPKVAAAAPAKPKAKPVTKSSTKPKKIKETA
jgi:diacylglycerol O-acyltransferase / wax synthase